jgi:hypothetical protein
LVNITKTSSQLVALLNFRSTFFASTLCHEMYFLLTYPPTNVIFPITCLNSFNGDMETLICLWIKSNNVYLHELCDNPTRMQGNSAELSATFNMAYLENIDAASQFPINKSFNVAESTVLNVV